MNRRTLFILVGIAIAHAFLAGWYASITPWRTGGMVLLNHSVEKDIGAPDERQHTNYIERLAAGGGFPVFNPQATDLYETYQSHQPPAYYLLGTAWSKVVATGDLEIKDSGFRLRLLSVLIGAATVVGVFFLGLWGFGREDLGLVAAAFCAFLPMFVALSGAVSNDPMLISLCTWVLALCARGIKLGWSWKLVVGVGLLTGIGFLTKTTAIGLLLALLAAALVPQTKKPSLAMAAVLVGVAVLIAAPWWARNQSLYGDPLAMTAFNQAFQGSAQKSQMVAMIDATGNGSAELTYWKDWVGWWTARSFFGAFGYMDIWLNETGTAVSSRAPNALYRLLLVAMIVVFVGWLVATRKPEWQGDRSVQMVNGVFLAVVMLLFVRFNMQYFQAQARYVLPAIGPISCGVGIGMMQLMKNRGSLAFGIVSAVLLGVNGYALSSLPGEFAKRIQLGSGPVQ